MADAALGIFGGMFDPPHVGHVELVRAALESGVVGEVLVIPAGPTPSHRAAPHTAADARLELTRAAFSEVGHATVSDLEIARAAAGGSSYAIDTVLELETLHPGRTLVLLVGADQLVSLPQWHSWRELIAHVEIGVVARPDQVAEARLIAAVDELTAAGARIHRIPMDPRSESSTDIRAGRHAARTAPDRK